MVDPVSALVASPYAVLLLASSVSNYVSRHFNREETKITRRENFAFQQGVEDQRQQMQIAQMKLSIVRQREAQDFQEKLAQENREFQREIEEFRQSVNIAIHQSNINFQKWRFEQEKELQLEILSLNQVFQQKMNLIQHQNALLQIEKRISEDRENPLLLLASRLLKSPFSNGIAPLKILLAPPELDYDVNKPQGSGLRIESFLAEEIRQFLRLGYGTNDPERPTELLDRAWSSKKFGGGAAIRYLYDELKSIPVLVLESEFTNENINLRLSYWDGEVIDPDLDAYSPKEEVSLLSRFSYRDFLLNSAKSRAIEWRKTKTKLLEKGFDEARIRQSAKNFNEENLEILERDEQLIAELQAANMDLSQFNIGNSYEICKEDWDAFYDYLAFLHCIATGAIADIMVLQRSYQTKPLLPQLLPGLLSKLNINAETGIQTIEPIIKLYRNFYKGIEEQTQFYSLVPDITIDFALSLTDLSDKSFAVEEAKYSTSIWLKLHGVEPDKIFDLNSDEDCKLLKSIIYQEDEAYLIKLQQFLEKVGGAVDGLEQINSLLAGWQNLKHWNAKILNLPNVEKFSFEVITVDVTGEIINRETKTNKQQIFDLGDGIKLEMVYIPGGSFIMGAPDDEEGSINCEKLGHKVSLEPFWIAKYPITQAQYQAVMDKNPSRFIGKDHPVESLIFPKDTELFCSQLSKKLNRKFKLPSEAQWEYACRAETTSPFHFGGTITTELANYDGSKSYSKGFRGINRAATTPVGTFPPNAFGLYDMHGNVAEICANNWLANYDNSFDEQINSPELGTILASEITTSRSSIFKDVSKTTNFDQKAAYNSFRMDSDFRVKNIKDVDNSTFRGGSWNSYADCCRCASRDSKLFQTTEIFRSQYGFRCISDFYE